MSLKRRHSSVIAVIALVTGMLFFTQNCGMEGSKSFTKASVDEGATADEFTHEQPEPPPVDPLEGLKEINALVYGSSAEDRDFLARKIAGYTAPGLQEIFQKWQRMSGKDLYSNGNITPESDYGFCFTGIDPITGNWRQGQDQNGVTIKNPGTSNKCYGSSSFTASSWIFMEDTQRLRCPTNSGRYIGFLSALKFDRFIHEAILTSSTTDDDTIALIIAAKVDAAGHLHTLSAARSQGDTHSKQSAKGWTVVYRRSGSFVAEYGAKEVGGIFPHNNQNKVENGGWNGRMTKVRVERDGDVIKASTSIWGTKPSSLKVSAGSVITIDLGDGTKPELEIFRGPQSYGYATLSQAGAEFLDISFIAQSDDEHLFDLQENKVYEQHSSGTYKLMPGVDAFNMLKAPVKAGNSDTQKLYHLRANKTFELLN